MYEEFIVNNQYNEISCDGGHSLIEPVWSIQKDQLDVSLTQEEYQHMIQYNKLVKQAQRYIEQRDYETVAEYTSKMNQALYELKQVYNKYHRRKYTFTCGSDTFRAFVPGVPIYVTESNYLSRYLHIYDMTLLVFWKQVGKFNIAYVSSELRPSFDAISALISYDFTCQVRSTLADITYAIIPCHASLLNLPKMPLRQLWKACRDGRVVSSRRQLIEEEEVNLNLDALELMSYGLSKNVFTYAHKIGTHTWLTSLPDSREVYLWSGLFSCDTRASWTERAKEISLALKPCIRYKAKTYCRLVEADALANRHEDDPLNWEEEKRIRTTPVDNLVPAEYVYSVAHHIFTNKRDAQIIPRRQTYEQFIMELPMTIPEGAWYEPTCERDSSLRSKLAAAGLSDNVAGSKAVQILKLMPEEIKSLLNKDHIDVKTQIKVEWSKLRALYPTDVASNLQCAFVAGDVERYLPSNCLIGAGYSDDKVNAIMQALERAGRGISAGQDYKGFNEQHKTVCMQAIIGAWLDVYDRFLSKEQREVGRLVKENFARQTITFPDGEKLQLRDTLMSGSRWTTFLNTMFNYIYSGYIHKVADVKATTFHVGDDVYGRYDSLEDAEKVIYVANRLNVHMQIHKCFIYGSSEFLRKQYIGDNIYQYLCRSIATLVHSRWERDEPVRLRDRLNGLYERFCNYNARGGCTEAINFGRMIYRIAGRNVSNSKLTWYLSLPSSRGGVRNHPECDQTWVTLLKRLGLYAEDEDVIVVYDEEATYKVYKLIESLPLIRHAAYQLVHTCELPSNLVKEMRRFLAHRFTAATKFDNARVIRDPQYQVKRSRAQRIDRGYSLDSLYTRVHPYVRAMYAARRRGEIKRWFLNML